MNNDKKDGKQPSAKIFKKPIHDRATRKVSALPNLIRMSERPDGARAAIVEDESIAIDAPEGEISAAGLYDDLFGDLTDDD